MFTGIVEEMGEVLQVGKTLKIKLKNSLKQIKLGSSICVSGVCLTVFSKNENIVSFQVMPETTKKTSLACLEVGDVVNIETTLRVGDELGGHFVYGHVDTVVEILNIDHSVDGKLYTVGIPADLMQYIAPQGSLSLDGVSLTVARVGDHSATVALIDFTLSNTTFGLKKIGDKVNLEVDMLAKYVRNTVSSK